MQSIYVSVKKLDVLVPFLTQGSSDALNSGVQVTDSIAFAGRRRTREPIFPYFVFPILDPKEGV
jgi:hypothetical protein